uniref:hypothetical protein n=1 Tax=Ornithobacterium rhinotracheale TaxID=28251 RepID=UPI0039A66780
MQEIKNRIAVLKRKLLVKEVISLLRLDEYSEEIKCIENDEVTSNNLRKLYKYSEQHKVKEFDLKQFKLNNALILIDDISWREKEITFFIFYKERIQMILPLNVFLKQKNHIVSTLFNMDRNIVFCSENLKHGFCFLYDEYSVGFYKWNC